MLYGDGATKNMPYSSVIRSVDNENVTARSSAAAAALLHPLLLPPLCASNRGMCTSSYSCKVRLSPCAITPPVKFHGFYKYQQPARGPDFCVYQISTRSARYVISRRSVLEESPKISSLLYLFSILETRTKLFLHNDTDVARVENDSRVHRRF